MIVRPYWLYLVAHWGGVLALAVVVSALELAAEVAGELRERL